MQAIGDYYLLMKEIIKLDDKQILHELNGLEKLLGSSYLVNITKKIIESPKSKNYLIKNILDQVDDNNTGAWAAILSSDCKYPAPSLTSAVEARFISRQNRIFKNIKKTIKRKDNERKRIISDAQIITKISIASCYLQGLGLLKEISKIKKINFNFKSVILSWIKNSIIRSKLLERYLIIAKKSNIDIEYLAKKELSLKNRKILINFMKFTIKSNLFLPSSNSIFEWSNMLSNKKYISFSLIQAQRNFFGSHKLKFFKK